MSLGTVLNSYGFKEVQPMDLYKDMFRIGEGYLQRQGAKNGSRELKANPVAYYKDNDKPTGHFRVMFEDTFEDSLKKLQKADFAILNGITYFGRRNLQEHASKMYAMIFDIDKVKEHEIKNIVEFGLNDDGEDYPLPNYIVLSGHGVHLYYLFEEPIPLYPNIKLQLKELKFALTKRLWNKYTSRDKEVQYQGINQGFRVPGGKTKLKGVKVRVFRIHQHPYTLSSLNRYVPEAARIDETKLFKESKYTIAEAKQKFPEWYERVIVNKDHSGKTWTVKRDLYDWWKRRIPGEARKGHRYFACMCLAIYGAKCGLSEDEVLRDAMEIRESLDTIPEDPFTESDIKSAMECFDLRYCRFPRADMARLSDMQMLPNKRNGRKQTEHMAVMRAIEMVVAPDWRNKDGAPSKKALVKAWQRNHPEGTKAECVRETGLSKPTVYKWW